MNLENQIPLLDPRDRTRVNLKQTIATIKPSGNILDAGNGLGVLTTMSARTGASRVEAADRIISPSACHVADGNGVGDGIVARRADFGTNTGPTLGEGSKPLAPPAELFGIRYEDLWSSPVRPTTTMSSSGELNFAC